MNLTGSWRIRKPAQDEETVYISEKFGVRNLHIGSDTVQSAMRIAAPNDLELSYTRSMMGFLLFNEKPKSVLIVGFGAGVTAGSFVTYPEIERIVICELEPLIPTNVGPYFVKQNYNVAHDPRVQIVYDDARHFVLTTKEKFDVITSDPIHPWVKGAATLYTKEYFEMVKAHLKPGGVLAFQATNRFINIAPIVASLAAEYGMSAVLVSDLPTSEEGPDYWTASTDQVIVTKNRALLEAEPIKSVATPIEVPAGFRAWTDDFNNLLRVLK